VGGKEWGQKIPANQRSIKPEESHRASRSNEGKGERHAATQARMGEVVPPVSLLQHETADVGSHCAC